MGDDGLGLSLSLEWLRRFTALKELNLHAPVIYPPEKEHYSDEYMYEEKEEEQLELQYSLCLTRLVDILSGVRLETLQLYNVHSNYNNSKGKPVYPLLTNLTLPRSAFQPSTNAFIAQIFPNLKRLTMDCFFFNGGSFSVPNIDLSYLELTNTVVYKSFTVTVTTLGNDQRRLYNSISQSCHFEDHKRDIKDNIFNLLAISFRPFDEPEDTPMVTIVYNSPYDFILGNSRTY